jgi:hypothetical protein
LSLSLFLQSAVAQGPSGKLKSEAVDRAIDVILEEIGAEQAELMRLVKAPPELNGQSQAIVNLLQRLDARQAELNRLLQAKNETGGPVAETPPEVTTPPSAAPSSPAPVAAVTRPEDIRGSDTSSVIPLLTRGRSLFGAIDIAGARLMFERAAIARDPEALTALAQTYDPDVLRRMRVRGVRPDHAKADALYREAQAARAEAVTGA